MSEFTHSPAGEERVNVALPLSNGFREVLEQGREGWALTIFIA